MRLCIVPSSQFSAFVNGLAKQKIHINSVRFQDTCKGFRNDLVTDLDICLLRTFVVTPFRFRYNCPIEFTFTWKYSLRKA